MASDVKTSMLLGMEQSATFQRDIRELPVVQKHRVRGRLEADERRSPRSVSLSTSRDAGEGNAQPGVGTVD